jgi:hypothetical protein
VHYLEIVEIKVDMVIQEEPIVLQNDDTNSNYV